MSDFIDFCKCANNIDILAPNFIDVAFLYVGLVSIDCSMGRRRVEYNLVRLDTACLAYVHLSCRCLLRNFQSYYRIFDGTAKSICGDTQL